MSGKSLAETMLWMKSEKENDIFEERNGRKQKNSSE